MTTLQLPIEIEPGIDMFDQIRRMTDDEFYYFCQKNQELKFERDANHNIINVGLTGGEIGELTSELIGEVGIWNRQTKFRLRFVNGLSPAQRSRP